MGELDFIVQSLKLDYRREISDELGMNYSFDTNLMVVSDAINMLRYLRNACAHNDVVYDSRFAGRDASSEIKNLLVHELGIAAPTFKRITDFVALIAILLRKLGSSKTEVRSFLNRFMRISEAFESSIPPRIATIVLPGSWKSEIQSISSGI